MLVFAAGTTDSGIERSWAATDTDSGIALLPDLSDATVDRIAQHVVNVKRPNDIAVLSIHWGGNWGYQISRQQTVFAHKLIDVAAVDVVHGHSSHHAKGIEIYKGKAILYGCGDFLNDYEGIAGYEMFRSHLVLAYFLTIDQRTGTLRCMEIVPFETKRFQLQHPGPQDAAWLLDMLAREGKPLGTWPISDRSDRFALAWSH